APPADPLRPPGSGCGSRRPAPHGFLPRGRNRRRLPRTLPKSSSNRSAPVAQARSLLRLPTPVTHASTILDAGSDRSDYCPARPSQEGPSEIGRGRQPDVVLSQALGGGRRADRVVEPRHLDL